LLGVLGFVSVPKSSVFNFFNFIVFFTSFFSIFYNILIRSNKHDGMTSVTFWNLLDGIGFKILVQ
jgi:hypothetical protein